MNTPTYAELENELKALLDFPYQIAAVRLLKTEEEYQHLAIPEPKSALNYCQMVKAALMGHSFKASQARHFRCLAGPSTIGILPYPAESESGENLCDIGMYRDLVVAHDIAQKMAHCPHWAYGCLLYTSSRAAYHVVIKHEVAGIAVFLIIQSRVIITPIFQFYQVKLAIHI